MKAKSVIIGGVEQQPPRELGGWISHESDGRLHLPAQLEG